MGDHSLTAQRSGLVPSTVVNSTSAPSLSISSLATPYPTSTSTATTNPLIVNADQAKSSSTNTIQPSPGQRMISACAGSLITSLLVTPLDVVKTRLQSQTVIATPTCAIPFSYTNDASAYEKLCTCCREVFFAPNKELPASSLTNSTSTTATATAGLRQNAANMIAAAKRLSPRASSRTPPKSTSGALTGCGSSIVQQHQEGTVIGMKASRLQQQRLELLAANCIENNHISKAAQDRYFHGTWDGVKKIVRYEGASSLWRGLSPTVAMSIPATVIYFVGYDYLKEQLSEHMVVLEQPPREGSMAFLLNDYRASIAPLVAGGFARTVAATVISPLELFRTRMQSVHTDTKGNSGLFRGVFQGIVSMVRKEGALSLWRGLAPTLWRDVPFSAIYWMGYENIKKNIITWDKRNHPGAPALNEFEIAFASGAISGMIAATLTTPFDVAKTRRQVDLAQPVHTKMIKLMRAIVEEEGFRGLWRGLTARVAKVAPSCAIMISSYEIGKKALSEQWWGIGASSSSPPSSSSSSSSSSSTSSGSGSETSGPTMGGGGGGGPEDRLIHLREATIPRLAAST